VNLLVSAGVSAVVSAVVSLLAVAQTTARQLKATRADKAKQSLTERVARVRLMVRLYRAHRLASAGRKPDSPHMDDLVFASDVMRLANDIPRWRRRLVARRLRRIVGAYWAELAQIVPAPGALGAMDSWLQAEMRGDVDGDPASGLLHRALCQPPGDRLQLEAEKQLRRLSAAR
jgi:hypothetical protein